MKEAITEEAERAKVVEGAGREYRRLAAEYQLYLRNPANYPNSEEVYIQGFKDKGVTVRSNVSSFKQMYDAGATPENFEELASGMGERFGDLYDFEQSLGELSVPQLEVKLVELQKEYEVADQVYFQAYMDVDPEIDALREPQTAEWLDNMGIGDADAINAACKKNAATAILLKIGATEKVLAEKKDSGAACP